MDCLEVKEAKKRAAQAHLQWARNDLYKRLKPEKRRSIKSSLIFGPALNNNISSSIPQPPNEEHDEPATSGTSQSVVQMPPRRLGPSLKEITRPFVRRTKPKWTLHDNYSMDRCWSKRHEAQYNSARILLDKININVFQMRSTHSALELLAQLPRAGKQIQLVSPTDRCTEILIRHFEFLGKFAEIADLHEQRRKLDEHSYSSKVASMTGELSEKAELFLRWAWIKLTRDTKLNRRRYERHREFNYGRGTSGSHFPPRSLGRPSRLRFFELCESDVEGWLRGTIDQCPKELLELA
ncbi:hypothetical protein F5Y11DRAFT_362838 [Daldinia sp. FL1419]|nr:hypothetical protein F5Y11DRAFT_362838 [Daldinia sp. FL1419]